MTSLKKAIFEETAADSLREKPMSSVLNGDEHVTTSTYIESCDFNFDGTFSNISSSFSTNSLSNLVEEPRAQREVHKDAGNQNPLVQRSGKKGIRKMYLAALASMTNAVSTGVCSTYSGPATYDMQKHPNSAFSVDDDDITWIGSVISFGIILGGLIAGPLADKTGRKGYLIFNSLTFLISWLMMMYAKSVPVLIAGRFVSGIACAAVYAVLPIYAVEISTPDSRGLLGASFQASVAIGTLLVMALGAFIPWTWLAVSGSIVGIVALLSFYPMPESPRWLIAQKRRKEALAAIRYLQGDDFDAEGECKVIEDDFNQQQKGRLTLGEFMHPTIYKPALISLSLLFFVHSAGSTVVILYTSDIFDTAGSTLKPEYSTIIVGFIQVVATVVSTAIMDKAGRRILLLVSGFFMGLCLAVLGAFYFISANDESFKQQTGWLPVACLVVYMGAFNLGYGPIPFLMVSEMIPLRARSFVSGITTLSTGVFSFAFIKTYKSVVNAMHSYGAFWLYASFAFLSCVFVWFFVPETKGKPLEEIQYFFLKRPKSKDSETVVATVITSVERLQ